MIPEIQILKLEFENYIALSGREILNASALGMGEALKVWEDDAKNITPKVPVKSGWLRKHHRTRIERGLGIIGVLETYDTPYAGTVHSGVSRHGTSITYKHAAEGEGSHWISTKLYKYAEKYFQIIEQVVNQ